MVLGGMTTFLGAAGFLRGAFPLAGLLRGGDGVVDASRRMIRLPAMVLLPDGEVPSDLSVFLPSDRVLRGLSVMVSGCCPRLSSVYTDAISVCLSCQSITGFQIYKTAGCPVGRAAPGSASAASLRDFALHIPNPSKSASYARTFSALPLGVGTPDLLAAGLVAVVCPGGGASPV